MNLSYSNKVVLISGGARGMGRNLAMRFAELNAMVFILDKDQDKAQSVVQEISDMGKTAHFVGIDLTNSGDFSHAIKSIAAEHKRLDVLINNARGRGEKVTILPEKASDWEDMFKITLREPFSASIEFINAAKGTIIPGCILNISSVAACVVSHDSPSYHFSKAGLEAMTKYLAVQGGAFGVRVNAIRPGFIVQDEHLQKFHHPGNQAYKSLAEFAHPLRKIGSSNDVVDAAVFLCSENAKFITGQVLTVDGGLTIQDPWALLFSFGKSKGFL